LTNPKALLLRLKRWMRVLVKRTCVKKDTPKKRTNGWKNGVDSI